MKNLYEDICNYENLEKAFTKARKHKTLKPYIIEFEEKLKENLLQLQEELITQTYKPRPLKTFIIRGPKTRKISKSDFRDRVIHHAICNIIEPIFDKTFIYDSYANRIMKGTLKAIERFDEFKRKVSKNNHKACYFLKADIKHYFDTVDHQILFNILARKIEDEKVIWLIKQIFDNHKTIESGKGMPLENLTSQFFANVYLNELDQYVKHFLKAKYYIRYVDDFIILHGSIDQLQQYEKEINKFLKEKLSLELHPDKSKILKLQKGANFLGFRIFYNHKLIRKKNLKKFERKFNKLKKEYNEGVIKRERVIEKFEGWIAHISYADTYKYKRHLIREINKNFPIIKSAKSINTKKHQNYLKRTESSNVQFSSQKTLQLYKKGMTIKQIAQHRNIKESTVWEHLAKLIEHHQCKINDVLPKDKINYIKQNMKSKADSLKDVKKRISDEAITYDEINCVLSSIKTEKKE